MDPIRAIIVEDEESSQITLQNLLEKFCENVEVLGIAANVMEAVKLINKQSPDLVFLDIELPGQNGFELLDFYNKIPFEIVFTTAYDIYALKAIKLSAVDYLLKPIDLEELQDALKKVVLKRELHWQNKRIALLKENLNNSFQRLALPVQDGFEFVEIDDIVRLEANGNYTQFFFVSGDKILISKTLKYFEEVLSEHNFFRINRSDFISLKHIKKLSRNKKVIVSMKDGNDLGVAESRRDEFLQKMEKV
ncbi:MAG TPA: LytTR family DNA-binding domain-containing protein [Saprospiraceae bacterium]|nr:LytTR family DNA-binding domain-containing protein [Saprospiraceae bacterium]